MPHYIYVFETKGKHIQSRYSLLLYSQGELTDRSKVSGRRISGDISWVEIQSAKIAIKQQNKQDKRKKFNILFITI